MAYSKTQLSNLYQQRAAHYDLTANLYYLLGFREQSYRKQAVAALRLNAGDTVVEVGCGTGLNFPLLQNAIGPTGKIIGIDLTASMLDQARRRIENAGWNNIELIQADAAAYVFPQGIDGVLSTFALTLVPEYDAVIQHAATALSAGKRCVILDLKIPQRIPMWLVRFDVLVTRPFGVSLDLSGRHPWESIERHLKKTSFDELYLGFAYISAGSAG